MTNYLDESDIKLTTVNGGYRGDVILNGVLLFSVVDKCHAEAYIKCLEYILKCDIDDKVELIEE